MTKRILCENREFLVTAEFEIVTLTRKGRYFSGRRKAVVIGDFYGDVCAAAFNPDSSSVMCTGCGFVLYHLREPFEDYVAGQRSTQWAEGFRETGSVLWISEVEWESASVCRLTASQEEPEPGVYQVTLPEITITKI